MSNNIRYFVNLLGAGLADEALERLEQRHGEIAVDKHGRLNAKLNASLCGKHVYGIVEISPKNTT